MGRECQASITSQHNELSPQMMCYVCCKELKGWCKSFTRTEGLLSVLEAILLVVLISFLVFLILHFVACRSCTEVGPEKVNKTDFEDRTKWPDPAQKSTLPTSPATQTPSLGTGSTAHSTLPPHVNCTWQPSRRTRARTRYYLSDRPAPPASPPAPRRTLPPTSPESLELLGASLEPSHDYDDVEFLEQSDGEPAENSYKSQVAALVKLEPPGDVTFGCILTKITKFWTLTAASCIESIEEVDSLDSFVIVEQFGERRALRPRAVVDVRMHARAGHARAAHDLAALRAERALRWHVPLRLPRLLDYFLIALGERFHILGYGGYRTVEARGGARRLRQVSVFVVASAACAAAERGPQWAARHLVRGAATRHGACGAAPLCAGARYSRGTPCNYCAGAPLLRGGTLYGIMSDNDACGVACEPQLYVNIATLRDWIDSVIE